MRVYSARVGRRDPDVWPVVRYFRTVPFTWCPFRFLSTGRRATARKSTRHLNPSTTHVCFTLSAIPLLIFFRSRVLYTHTSEQENTVGRMRQIAIVPNPPGVGGTGPPGNRDLPRGGRRLRVSCASEASGIQQHGKRRLVVRTPFER